MLGAPSRIASRPTNEGFIDLDTPTQAIASWSYHGPTKFVEPGPSGRVTPQSQEVLDAHGTGAVLLSDDVPDGSEPQNQRLMRILKDRACRDGGLIPTPPANQTATSGSPRLRGAAAWADKPLWPTKPEQVVAARLLSRETLLQLDDRPRVIFHTRTLHVVEGGVNWIATTDVN